MLARKHPGTHLIEHELIRLCAEQILQAEPDSCDGYVAAGGTGANWYRVVVINHLIIDRLVPLLEDLKTYRKEACLAE